MTIDYWDVIDVLRSEKRELDITIKSLEAFEAESGKRPSVVFPKKAPGKDVQTVRSIPKKIA